jgi:GT2 family glycosyltransferase
VLAATGAESALELSIVLATRERLAFLRATIESVRAAIGGINAEIIVLAGRSTDGTVEWLAAQPDIVVIPDPPAASSHAGDSWGTFMNRGFKAARAEIICMISDDCLVTPGALGVGLGAMRASRGANIGALAFAWRNWPEDRRYGLGRTFGNCLVVNHGMFRVAALSDVGYCDADSFHFYHADGDLCLRIWQAGWRVEGAPTALVDHYSHANMRLRRGNATWQPQDWATYCERWKHLGRADRDWEYVQAVDASGVASQYWGSEVRYLPRTVLIRMYRFLQRALIGVGRR